MEIRKAGLVKYILSICTLISRATTENEAVQHKYDSVCNTESYLLVA